MTFLLVPVSTDELIHLSGVTMASFLARVVFAGMVVLASGERMCEAKDVQPLNKDGLSTCTAFRFTFEVLSSSQHATIAAMLPASSVGTMMYRQSELGSEGAVALGAALSESTQLTTLTIREDNIGLEGARAVAQVLTAGVRLSLLDLRQARLTPEGGMLLADALRNNSDLAVLNLRAAGIGQAGAIAVAAAALTRATPVTPD